MVHGGGPAVVRDRRYARQDNRRQKDQSAGGSNRAPAERYGPERRDPRVPATASFGGGRFTRATCSDSTENCVACRQQSGGGQTEGHGQQLADMKASVQDLSPQQDDPPDGVARTARDAGRHEDKGNLRRLGGADVLLRPLTEALGADGGAGDPEPDGDDNRILAKLAQWSEQVGQANTPQEVQPDGRGRRE